MNLAGTILGHLVGDYLLQGQWMAMNKKKHTFEGLAACAVHCSIWTACVMFFGEIDFTLTSVPLVFMSHAILDRTYLASKYMALVNIFNWREVCKTNKITDAQILHYAIVDNVWHLVFLWTMAKTGLI